MNNGHLKIGFKASAGVIDPCHPAQSSQAIYFFFIYNFLHVRKLGSDSSNLCDSWEALYGSYVNRHLTERQILGCLKFR